MAVGALFAAMIAMPGGSGKTILSLKHPDKFIDIDDFVWEHAHDELYAALDSRRFDVVSEIYKRTMLTHRNALDRTKIILAHHPTNAEWLNASCIARIRPSKALHEENLRRRNQSCSLNALARAGYNAIGPAEEYNSHEGIERRCLQLWAGFRDI